MLMLFKKSKKLFHVVSVHPPKGFKFKKRQKEKDVTWKNVFPRFNQQRSLISVPATFNCPHCHKFTEMKRCCNFQNLRELLPIDYESDSDTFHETVHSKKQSRPCSDLNFNISLQEGFGRREMMLPKASVSECRLQSEEESDSDSSDVPMHHFKKQLTRPFFDLNFSITDDVDQVFKNKSSFSVSESEDESSSDSSGDSDDNFKKEHSLCFDLNFTDGDGGGQVEMLFSQSLTNRDLARDSSLQDEGLLKAIPRNEYSSTQKGSLLSKSRNLRRFRMLTPKV